MKLTPYPFQVKDLEKLRANNFTGLLSIEAGGGKTYLATLALAEVNPDVTLIIAPKSTHMTAWIPTVRDNADRTPRIMGNGNKAQREAYQDFLLGFPGVYLTTPQWLTRQDTSEWSGDMLIVDEVHQVSTMGSKAQKAISGYSARDPEPIAQRFDHRLALSGTPMRQAFGNLWSTMRLLWPELNKRGQVAHDNSYAWMLDRMDATDIVTGVDWFEVTWDQYRNREDGEWAKVIDGVPHLGTPNTVKKYTAEAKPGRLFSEAPCVIVHKRRETCCDDPSHEGGFLPTEEPQIIEREVELTAKQKKAIREMEASMFTYLNENPLIADIPLTQKQRIRQLTLGEAEAVSVGDDKTSIEFPKESPSPFLDETIHILSNLPEGEPVVIFLESQRYAEVLTYRLTKAGYKAEEYSGKRKADLEQFGKDYQVLVGVLSALGTGTAGLNHKAHTEIVFEQPVSLTLKAQGEARLERLDNKHQVQRYILLDDLGVQAGRVDDLLAKQILVNRSVRVLR